MNYSQSKWMPNEMRFETNIKTIITTKVTATTATYTDPIQRSSFARLFISVGIQIRGAQIAHYTFTAQNRTKDSDDTYPL